MILALQTTTFSAHGGIPTYNRVVARVLNDFETSIEKRLLVVTDTPKKLEARRTELPDLKLKAFASKRGAFFRHVLQLGLTRRIDLVLVGHVNYAPLGLALKLMQSKLRYGVMLYGIDAWQPLGRLRKHALQKADFMISISEYTKQKAVGINALDPKRIYLLQNALQCEGFSRPVDKESSTRSETRLLSVCRLEQSEQYKGVDKVIEALPSLAKEVPDVQYTVVGGGNDLERHRDLAKSLNVIERVHFLGFLSDEDLRACYRDCDVFVMPSAGEGFGFVYLEAMQHGKPIVAATSGGAPEVVKDGITGRLVEYGNKEQLAEVLIDLCLDPDKRQRLGSAGYQRLHQEFTFEQFQQKLTDILVRELPSPTIDPSDQPEVTPTAQSL